MTIMPESNGNMVNRFLTVRRFCHYTQMRLREVSRRFERMSGFEDTLRIEPKLTDSERVVITR